MSGSTRHRAAWAILGIVVLATLAISFWPRGGHETEAAHVRRLASELRCVDCEGLSVAESATASAREQRRDIRLRVRRGQSDDTIRARYVELFGESILLKPSSRGVGLLVWALPIAVVLVGAVGLAFALRRWQRQPRLAPSEDDVRLVAERRAGNTDG